MTQEEKAKAYDEVVNKLKGFVAQGVDPLITRADVQDFFPELKESEDERMRKELIAMVKEDWPGRDDVLVWLEKQSKQNPVDFYKAKDFSELVGMLVQDIVANEKDAANFGDEKKPTKHFIEEYLPKFEQLLKPAEWSEEDEIMLDRIAKRLDNTIKSNFTLLAFGSEAINRLSEELDWLKSLSPQNRWKPSEEQMKALYNVSTCHVEHDPILCSLYNELKELTE